MAYYTFTFLNIPRLQVNANWIAFPPAPQNASTTTSHLQRRAIYAPISSGVTEYQHSTKK